MDQSNAYTTVKHTLTVQASIFEALGKSAEKRGIEINQLIVDLIVEATIRDGTLDDQTKARYRLGRSLVDRVVETAVRLCEEGKFSESITLDAIRTRTADPEWATDYRTFIENDIYKHGNPLKIINREFGSRIRAAINGLVKKDALGKVLNVKVVGEIIQSYTPMAKYDLKS